VRKPKRFFSLEQKQRAVDDYVSGRKSAAEVAAEYEVPAGFIYKWRVYLESKIKDERVGELEGKGLPLAEARHMLRLEEELLEYKRRFAELALENDLLKKLRGLKNSRSESELNGLIEILKGSGRRKGPAK
jgi:transposase-like protein